MFGKTVEFVGGPLDGDRCKAKYQVVGELVFLSRVVKGVEPFVHLYGAEAHGDDFAYRGTREYRREDAGRIMGTVP